MNLLTAIRIVLILALLLSTVPLIVANYQGLRALPAQAAFFLMLLVPAAIFIAVSFLFNDVWMIAVPGALAVGLQALVLHTYFTSTSSTTAIVLYLIPMGHAVIFVSATTGVWLVRRML